MGGWQDRFELQPRARWFATAAYLLGHLALGVAYTVPEWSITTVLAPSQVNVVSYIDSIGPWWTVGFGLSALAIAVSFGLMRGLHLAHQVGGVVLTGYAMAAWFGVWLSKPTRPWPSAVSFTVAAVVELALSVAMYATVVGARR